MYVTLKKALKFPTIITQTEQLHIPRMWEESFYVISSDCQPMGIKVYKCYCKFHVDNCSSTKTKGILQ